MFIEVLESTSKRLVLRHYPKDFWLGWGVYLTPGSCFAIYLIYQRQYFWYLTLYFIAIGYFALIHCRTIICVFDRNRNTVMVRQKSLTLKRVFKCSLQEVLAVRVVPRKTRSKVSYKVELELKSNIKLRLNSSETFIKEEAEDIVNQIRHFLGLIS